jgi:hypothetical protein
MVLMHYNAFAVLTLFDNIDIEIIIATAANPTPTPTHTPLDFIFFLKSL